MADFNIEQTVKKIPPWGWVAIVGGIGVVLYLQNRSSSTPAASAPVDTGTGSSNPTTPTGQCNPSPEIPVCPVGDSITWQTDQNGCPIPVCSPTVSNAASKFVTTDGHLTYYTASQVYKEWGDLTIKYYATLHSEIPNAASYGYDEPLPAGHQLKVGGSFP